MDASVRKKSPRAPSLPLDDAIERTAKLYDIEGRHPTSADVVAQGLGYKDSNNGRAAQTLASLRYYGLVERPREGFLAVSKDFESYKFAPDPNVKRELLVKWLRTPPVFDELLSAYDSRLPSDGTLKYDLIQKGFAAATADSCVALFRRSVEYVKYYETSPDLPVSGDDVASIERGQEARDYVVSPPPAAGAQERQPSVDASAPSGRDVDREMVRIPVRLPKNRQAWLEIPIPFFEADKKRLKAFIDLQLTDDEDGMEPED